MQERSANHKKTYLLISLAALLLVAAVVFILIVAVMPTKGKLTGANAAEAARQDETASALVNDLVGFSQSDDMLKRFMFGGSAGLDQQVVYYKSGSATYSTPAHASVVLQSAQPFDQTSIDKVVKASDDFFDGKSVSRVGVDGPANLARSYGNDTVACSLQGSVGASVMIVTCSGKTTAAASAVSQQELIDKAGKSVAFDYTVASRRTNEEGNSVSLIYMFNKTSQAVAMYIFKQAASESPQFVTDLRTSTDSQNGKYTTQQNVFKDQPAYKALFESLVGLKKL